MLLLVALVLALPDALLNRSYTPEPVWVRVWTRCAMPIPVTRIVSGDLPAGMQVSGQGDLQGIPTEPGHYTFTVEVSDGCSRHLEQRQIRVLPAPILTAEAQQLAFHCPQGSPAFSGGIVRVSGSAPGRPYSVDILDGQWLEAAMRDGVLPAEGAALEADTIRISINPSKLAPGDYTARLRLSMWQGANAPELLFRLRVDSPQTLLTPLIIPQTAPIQIIYQIVEAPSAELIQPLPAPRLDGPHFPVYRPKSDTGPGYYKPGSRPLSRSRVLPFPKVTITPKPLAKPGEKDGRKPETMPARTKPSAMPPSPAASAKNDKPKTAH